MSSEEHERARRRFRQQIRNLEGLLLKVAANSICLSLDFHEMAALLSNEGKREHEIAEAAIARARQRGIE